jgi:hypothetical protein
LKRLKWKVRKPYIGDSTIFEIACYSYTYIDWWLYNNKPDSREKISYYFYAHLIMLFSAALDIRKVKLQELFNERLIKYGELLSKNEGSKNIYKFLIEMLRRTIFDTLPENANFTDFNFFLSGIKRKDFLEDILCYELQLNIEMATFELHMIQGMIKTIEAYLDFIK